MMGRIVNLQGTGKVAGGKPGRRLEPDVLKLKDTSLGRPACVLGSGPNLIEDFRKRPENPVLISVNIRPIHFLAAIDLVPDYIVFADSSIGYDLKEMEVAWGRRVSILDKFTDWYNNSHLWYGGYSSTIGAHLASLIGCDPIILMGMDCYQSKLPYFTSQEGETHELQEREVDVHLDVWKQAFDYIPDAGRIHVASGPLTKVFKEWG